MVNYILLQNYLQTIDDDIREEHLQQDGEVGAKYSNNSNHQHDLAGVAGTLPTTPGMTHPIGAYHQTTHTCYRIGTSHQQITTTHCNTSTMSNLQTCGRTSAHSYADIRGHFMWHTVTNEPHHVFTSGHSCI